MIALVKDPLDTYQVAARLMMIGAEVTRESYSEGIVEFHLDKPVETIMNDHRIAACTSF